VKGCFLYLIGQLSAGGSERQLYYLLQSLDRDRYEVAVAVWNFSEADVYVPRIRALGVPLYYFPKEISSATKMRLVRRLVRTLKPNVVHSYSFYTNFAAHWAALGTPTVAFGSVRGEFATAKKDSGPWLGVMSARWPRQQICNSFVVARTISCLRGFFVPRRISIVPNGIDLEHFRYLPVSDCRRTNILGLGSLVPLKRWDRLLTAASSLKRGGFDFHVQISGDGPLGSLLKQQASALGLTDCVGFTGHSENVRDLLANATFLTHTSCTEGRPNVVMEAMACGRAVIATDVGDVRSLIEDGTTGFVVRDGDQAMLVKRMETLINNRDLCRRMGEAGRVKAEREFGLDHLAHETMAAYRAAGCRRI
jgi:glycosyltransferase involved in cell wall biosynthesis